MQPVKWRPKDKELVTLGYRGKDGSPSSPHEWQAEFHKSNATIRWLTGGLQSGKTSSAVLEGEIHSWESPSNVGLVCRETMPLLKDTVLRTYLSRMPNCVKFLKSEMTMYFPNKSIIMFRALVSSSGERQARKFGSYKLGWFHIEEGDILREDEFLLLLGRLNLISSKRRQCWVSMNPVNPSHWVMKFIQTSNTTQQVFKSTTYENANNLPPNFIDELEKTYGSEWTARYLRGENIYIAEGSRVYPEFSEEVHCICSNYLPSSTYKKLEITDKATDRWGERTTYSPVLRGWDFGYLHPAVVFGQFDSQDRFIVQHEFMGSMLTTDELCQIVLYLSGQKEVGSLSTQMQRLCYTSQLDPFYTNIDKKIQFEDYCDPAGASISVQTGKSEVNVLNTYDIHPHYRKSEVMEGVEIIRHLLNKRTDGTPGLYLDAPNCPILRQGFNGGYQIGLQRGILKDTPVKDGWYDHLFDALRYILLHTSKPFEDRRSSIRENKQKYVIPVLDGCRV